MVDTEAIDKTQKIVIPAENLPPDEVEFRKKYGSIFATIRSGDSEIYLSEGDSFFQIHRNGEFIVRPELMSFRDFDKDAVCTGKLTKGEEFAQLSEHFEIETVDVSDLRDTNTNIELDGEFWTVSEVEDQGRVFLSPVEKRSKTGTAIQGFWIDLTGERTMDKISDQHVALRESEGKTVICKLTPKEVTQNTLEVHGIEKFDIENPKEIFNRIKRDHPWIKEEEVFSVRTPALKALKGLISGKGIGLSRENIDPRFTQLRNEVALDENLINREIIEKAYYHPRAEMEIKDFTEGEKLFLLLKDYAIQAETHRRLMIDIRDRSRDHNIHIPDLQNEYVEDRKNRLFEMRKEMLAYREERIRRKQKREIELFGSPIPIEIKDERLKYRFSSEIESAGEHVSEIVRINMARFNSTLSRIGVYKSLNSVFVHESEHNKFDNYKDNGFDFEEMFVEHRSKYYLKIAEVEKDVESIYDNNATEDKDVLDPDIKGVARLDNIMRQLYTECKKKGYTPEDVERSYLAAGYLRDLKGEDGMVQFMGMQIHAFDKMVNDVLGINFDEYMQNCRDKDYKNR